MAQIWTAGTLMPHSRRAHKLSVRPPFGFYTHEIETLEELYAVLTIKLKESSALSMVVSCAK